MRMNFSRLGPSAAALIGLLAGCNHFGHTAEAAKPARSSEEITIAADKAKALAIETVGQHSVEESLVTSGRVAFEDIRVAHVFSPVTGRVVSLDAPLGAHVTKGAPLARITSPDLGQASSDLGKAQADLAAAERDYNRKKAYFEQNAESASSVEQAEDAFRQARAERERAWQKARLLRSGNVDLVTQSFTLTSPIEGDVFVRAVNPGIEVVGQYSNGAAAELFTVGNIDKVWLMSDVYESDLARVAPGAKVTAQLVAYPGRTFTGTVDWISASLDPNTRTAVVRCVFDNPEHLIKPEMYATARIAVTGKNLVAVKRSAVFRMGEQPMVFVASAAAANGPLKLERLPVLVDDAYEGDYIPVLHGLEPGDRVVTEGAVELTRQMATEAAKEEASKGEKS